MCWCGVLECLLMNYSLHFGHIGMGALATGTAYFIPARVGVWLVWCCSWGPLGDSGLSPLLLLLPPLDGPARCFSRYVSGDGALRDALS